jgi:hypothetical protein
LLVVPVSGVADASDVLPRQFYGAEMTDWGRVGLNARGVSCGFAWILAKDVMSKIHPPGTVRYGKWRCLLKVEAPQARTGCL